MLVAGARGARGRRSARGLGRLDVTGQEVGDPAVSGGKALPTSPPQLAAEAGAQSSWGSEAGTSTACLGSQEHPQGACSVGASRAVRGSDQEPHPFRKALYRRQESPSGRSGVARSE